MLDSLDTLIAFTLIFTVVSLLITIVVQMISSALNLRGQNLSWALAETFEAIEPTLAAQLKERGKKLADHVLKDALLSDNQIFGRVSRASALRPDELFDVLHRIATGRKEAPDEIRNDVIALFKALGVSEGDLRTAGATVKTAKDVIAGVMRSMQALPDSEQKKVASAAIAQMTEQMSALAQNAANAVAATAADAEARVKQAYEKFETWLGTGQERAQEWFTMHAKLATLAIAVVFAYGLQLDAVEIFTMASTDRVVRDQLVAQTSNVLGQAEKLLTVNGSVLEKAFGAWKAKLDEPIKGAVDGAALAVAPTDTRESLRRRIETALAGLPVKEAVAAAVKAFDSAVDAAAKTAMSEASANYKLVRDALDKTGFSILPATKDGRWGVGWWPLQIEFGHWLGMGFSILLLSLGAPFWFNTLKSLASLRSTVAGNISEEQKAGRTEVAGRRVSPPATVVPTTVRAGARTPAGVGATQPSSTQV